MHGCNICMTPLPVEKKEDALGAKYLLSIRSSEDKLRFMLGSAKILSTKVDFRTWLLEKAKLTVPLLADRCAIDVLVEHNGLERIAVQ